MISVNPVGVYLHFVGDYIIQTDAMATNKTKSWKWASIHGCLKYIGIYLL